MTCIGQPNIGKSIIGRDTPAPTGAKAIIYCDGSAPTRDGPTGIGYTLEYVADPATHKSYSAEVGLTLGPGTNNETEYRALILALRHAVRMTVTHVAAYSDSTIVVNQLTKNWKVTGRNLKNLNQEAKGLMNLFTEITITHIHREDNEKADYLSKHPTPILPEEIGPCDIEDGPYRIPRKLSRRQAAMIRWWWKTHRCQNEYRLTRIFGLTESVLGKIGKGETYHDLTVEDLPKPADYILEAPGLVLGQSPFKLVEEDETQPAESIQ